MNHFSIDLLEKFESDHLPTRNEVLGRFLSAKTHAKNLSDHEAAGFVAQQAIQIWKAHKIPTVGVTEASNKLFQIVKRWSDIDKRRKNNYPKIQKSRADLHSSLGEIFDIFFGGLTGIKDAEIRQFYIDSCSRERIWNQPCKKSPISTVGQHVFYDVPLDSSTDESETKTSEKPAPSSHGMQTRSGKEKIQAVESSDSTGKKRKLQSKEPETLPQNLETPQEEQQSTSKGPSFLQELISFKQKQVHDSKSKPRLDFVETKKQRLRKQTDSARYKSIENRFALHLLRNPEQESQAMHQISESSTESDEEQSSSGRKRGEKGRFVKKTSPQTLDVRPLDPLSQTSTNPESLLSQASSRPDSDSTYDGSPKKHSERKSLGYAQLVAMDRTGTSNRGASRIALSFDKGMLTN